jgi:hypothetical protein
MFSSRHVEEKKSLTQIAQENRLSRKCRRETNALVLDVAIKLKTFSSRAFHIPKTSGKCTALEGVPA